MSGEEVSRPDKKALSIKEHKDFRSLDALGQMPIAIIGMAGKFPKSRNVSEFWDNLVQEKECIQFFSKEELLEEGLDEEEIEAKDKEIAKLRKELDKNAKAKTKSDEVKPVAKKTTTKKEEK